MNLIDLITASFAPRWTLARMRARAATTHVKRHYEAASTGRRTQGWTRNRSDVNALTATATAELRIHARHLTRNNSYAKRAVRVITNNAIGYGITPKPKAESQKATEAWKKWAESTDCDADGRRTFYGLQVLVLRSVVIDGEVLIRRRIRRPADLPEGTLPLQLQVLEADFIDTNKDGIDGQQGGTIIQGVEFDAIGRRTAYWLFEAHPGSSIAYGESKRVPASELLHIFDTERAGQTRGISWFGSAIVNLAELDEFEDAELLKQKVAACFAAFVTDSDGFGAALGEQDEDDPLVEAFEPGMISQLPPGKQVTVANPPSVTNESFRAANLRKVAVGIGLSYEEMTGDYSQVNFSSARMARLAHWANVRDWQWNMLVPQLCDGVWAWVMQVAVLSGQVPKAAAGRAEWTVNPMPMLEPDKEARAAQLQVRTGMLTPDGMVRERGEDPVAHWAEYERNVKDLKARGIKLDSLASDTSQAGLTQERVGGGGGFGGGGEKEEEPEPEAVEEEDRTVDDYEIDVQESEIPQ